MSEFKRPLKYIITRIRNWKWLNIFLTVIIALCILIISKILKVDANDDYLLNWFDLIDILDTTATAFIAGGAFTAFIKLFQYADIFKDEIKDVLLNEDILILSSVTTKENILINKLDSYSRHFLFSTFHSYIRRFYSNRFEDIYGKGFDSSIMHRIKKTLAISEKNYYVQKDLEIRYKITIVDSDHIRLTQKIKSKIYKVSSEKPIKISHIYRSWIPKNSTFYKNGKDVINIKKYKVGAKDFKKDFFNAKSNGTVNQLNHILTSKEIRYKFSTEFDVLDFDSEIDFTLSTKTFLYRSYTLGAYTKGVTIEIEKYDKRRLECLLITNTNDEKFESKNSTNDYMKNQISLFIPKDTFNIVINKK